MRAGYCAKQGAKVHSSISFCVPVRAFAQIFARFLCTGKTGDFERFLPFFRPCIFSEFHRSLLPVSMLCPDSDSRKGLFCIFPKAIGFVAGFGLAKAEPDSAKKSPLHKLFTTKPQNLIIISLLRAFLARRCSLQSYCVIEIEKWEDL